LLNLEQFSQLGILVLSFFPPLGIVLIMIGVGASVSGAFLVVVSAVITVLTKRKERSKTITSEAYGNGEANPEIVIDETLYSESFEDNLCHERQPLPDHLSAVHLPDGYLPNMEHLGKRTF
jgi:hypothetical protein